MFQRLGVFIAALCWATAAGSADFPPPKTEPTYRPSLLAEPASAVYPQWGVHFFVGASAGRSDLIDLIPMPWTGDYGDNYLVAGALSRRLVRNGDWMIDGEVGVGYRFKHVNAPEGWIALYLRYGGFPWNDIVYTTVAISTGLSYVQKVSELEKDAGDNRGNPDGTKLLHYFSPEFTFAHPSYRNHELVIRYHHRSGVFGTFNGVWGGSNVVTAGYRNRF